MCEKIIVAMKICPKCHKKTEWQRLSFVEAMNTQLPFINQGLCPPDGIGENAGIYAMAYKRKCGLCGYIINLKK